MDGNRVATSLEHIQRGFGNIHINVFPNGAVKGLYEFAVKVDLRILIMMDSQDKLAGDFHKTEILAQPNVAGVPIGAHVLALTLETETGPIRFPSLVIKGDFKPIVTGLCKGVFPDLSLAT